MNTSEVGIPQVAKDAKPALDAGLSKEGKRRWFPKVPGLLQYVSTGTYFARAKVDGKPIRKSLEADVLRTADFFGLNQVVFN